MDQPFNHRYTALEALAEAQRIAFGPVVFQCVHIAWKHGLLARLEETGGSTVEELAAGHTLSAYAIGVLLESCLSAGVVTLEDGHYDLGKVGHFVLHDRMTQINLDFMHDVCYRGLAELEASLREERPLGLATLGDWPTLYEGLMHFPEPARSSWLAFDHFYSDAAFAAALPLVFAGRPARLMDIGANTGKWARRCLAYSPDVLLTLVDLPQQLDVARQEIDAAGLGERAAYAPLDVLDPDPPFPAGQDAVWMSQFLTCFPIAAIPGIFRRARAALSPNGRVFVMDTFWDRQRFEAAAYSLINTSPYFTAIASGNSKMHRSDEIVRCAREAGLALLDVRDDLGICHSLLTFVSDQP